MKRLLRVLPAAAFSAVVLLAISWASLAPLEVAGSDDAMIRISLGARPERIEICTRQTDEELARLAPQMRQTVICEGTTARYRLEVRRNDTLLHSQVERGGGLRNDRPLYVFQVLRVPPGPTALAVRLARIDTIPATEQANSGDDDSDDDDGDQDDDGGNDRERREGDERRRRLEESVPADLRLELSMDLEPREVVLVSYDQRSRRLTGARGSP
jgi:hypothetical protein